MRMHTHVCVCVCIYWGADKSSAQQEVNKLRMSKV